MTVMVVSAALKPVSAIHYCISLNILFYIVSQKNIPNIFNCNFKKDYQILIIFGTSISETTGHQMTIHFLTSSNVCSCTTWDNRTNKIFLSNAV